MVETVAEVELRAFAPGESTPFVVFDDEIAGVSITETAQDAIDSGTIELESVDRPLQTGRVTSGDRLEFFVRLAGESSLTRRLTAIARDISEQVTAGSGIRLVSIEITDFVFSVLSFRVSDAGFVDEDAGDIVDSLVAADAPEVGRSQIETVGRDVTLSINGRKTLDVISQDLAASGDAVVAQDGTDIVFTSLSQVTPQFDLSTDDLHTPVTIQRVDDDLINRVRVDGGIDSSLDDEQPVQNATVRVTDSSRRVFQVASRKSEIDSVEVFTVKDSAADDGIVVRLQAERNGSAVDPTDRESDVASRELAPDFIAENGFTTFDLPDHSLAPAENPFVIVGGAGPTGHEIGTDGNGNETFRAFFPFKLLARAQAGNSQAEFRRRDLRRRDDQLNSEQAVSDAARGALRRQKEPTRRIEADAATTRAHELRPSDAVAVPNFPVSDVTGTYLVVDRSTQFTGKKLRTSLTFADVSTL
jgi:hypothetical protein